MLSSISLVLYFSAIRRNGGGWGAARGEKDGLQKSKPALCTECGQEVHFTLQLKEDEECPGRQESGRVADVSLCLLETHVGKQSPEGATPSGCKAGEACKEGTQTKKELGQTTIRRRN